MYENTVLRSSLEGNDPLPVPLSSLPSPTQASWECLCRLNSRATLTAFVIILHQSILLDPYPFHIPALYQLIDIPCPALFFLELRCSTRSWGSPSGEKDAKELVQLLPRLNSTLRLDCYQPHHLSRTTAPDHLLLP